MGIRGMTWSFEFGRSHDRPRRSDDHHGSSQWYQSSAVPGGRRFAGDRPECQNRDSGGRSLAGGQVPETHLSNVDRRLENIQKLNEEMSVGYKEMKELLMEMLEDIKRMNQIHLDFKQIKKNIKEEEGTKRKKKKVGRMKKRKRRLRTNGSGNKFKKEKTSKGKKKIGFRRKFKKMMRREDKKHEKRERSQTHMMKFWWIFKMCRRRKYLTGVHGGRRRKKWGGSSDGYCSWRYAGRATSGGGFKGGAVHCGCSGGGRSASVSGGGTTSFNYNLVQHGGARVRGDSGLVFYSYGGGFRGGGGIGGDHVGDTNQFAGTVFVFGGDFKGGGCYGGGRTAGDGGIELQLSGVWIGNGNEGLDPRFGYGGGFKGGGEVIDGGAKRMSVVERGVFQLGFLVGERGGGFKGGDYYGGADVSSGSYGGEEDGGCSICDGFGGGVKEGGCHGGQRVASLGGFHGGGHSGWCLNRDAGQYYGEWSALVGSCGVGWSSFLNSLDKFQKLLEQKKEEEGHKGIIVIILVGDVMNAGRHYFFFTGITCYCKRRYNGISFLKYSTILSNPISKVSGPSPSFNIQPGQYLSFLDFSTPCFWPNQLYYPPNFSTHHPLFYTLSVLNLLKLHSPSILITSNCNQEIFKFCYISINFTLSFLLNQDDLPSSKQQKMIFVTDFPTSLHSLKLSTRVANVPFLCPELHMITGILVHYALGSHQLIQGIDLSLKTLKGNWGTTLQRIKEVGIHDSHCFVVCWNSLVLVGLQLLAIPSSAIAAHKNVKMLEIAHTLVVLVGSFTKVMESFVHGLVRIVSGTHKSLLRAFHWRESRTIQSTLPNQDIYALSLNGSGKLYANQGMLGYEEEMCIGLFKPLLLIVEADHYPP